jgi:hypothetical protein
LIREVGPPDTAIAFEAMRALRTHYDDRDEFVRRVDEEQRPQGYRLVGAFDDAGRCEAVAGFRVIRNLAWGDCLISTTCRRCRRRVAAGTDGR